MLVHAAISIPTTLESFSVSDEGVRLKYYSGISMTVPKENHVNFSADIRCPKYKVDAVVNVGQNREAAMQRHHLRLWF
jgi:hypothetical protein